MLIESDAPKLSSGRLSCCQIGGSSLPVDAAARLFSSKKRCGHCAVAGLHYPTKSPPVGRTFKFDLILPIFQDTWQMCPPRNRRTLTQNKNQLPEDGSDTAYKVAIYNVDPGHVTLRW